MLDYSDFSTERLKTMLEQGEHFQEEKLNATFQELLKRGILSEEALEKERIRIEEKKAQLTDENHKQLEVLKLTNKQLSWKFRYYIYILILVSLGLYILKLKFF